MGISPYNEHIVFFFVFDAATKITCADTQIPTQ